MNYTVIPYEEKYRDDMIFMVLEAKNALGRVPSLNHPKSPPWLPASPPRPPGH